MQFTYYVVTVNNQGVEEAAPPDLFAFTSLRTAEKKHEDVLRTERADPSYGGSVELEKMQTADLPPKELIRRIIEGRRWVRSHKTLRHDDLQLYDGDDD